MRNLERDYVSVSSVNLHAECARKYFLRYTDTPAMQGDLSHMYAGLLVHEALEMLFNGVGTKTRIDGLMKDCKDYILRQADTYGVKASQSAIETFSAYSLHLVSKFNFNALNRIEERFEYTLPDSDITVKGVIDAVLETADGLTLLLDWKVRRYAVRSDAVVMDSQLYVYAYYLKNVLGIELDGAYQVQLLSEWTPARLRTNGTTHSMRGKTTLEQLKSDCDWYGLDFDVLQDTYKDKIVPIDDNFIIWSPIDLSLMDKFVSDFTLSAKRAMNDTEYPPVNKAYVCKYCQFLPICKDS